MADKPRFEGERAKLGDLISPFTKRNKDVLCTDVYSVTNSRGFTPSEDYFSKEVFSKDLKTYRIVKQGMIAYNPSRINVGSIAIQDKLPEVVVSPLYIVFETDKSRLLPEYALGFLRSKPGLDQIAFQSIGTVRNNLKYDALCRITINLPSLNRQRACIDQLNRIASIIELLNRYIAELDALVKSRFVEMFGEPTTRCGRWPLVRLDSFAQVVTGNTPSRKNPEYYGEGIEWVKTDNIVNSAITASAEQLTETGRAKARIAPAGSILMACIAGSVNSIGKVGLLDREAAFNQQINAIVPSCGVNSRFLLTMLTLSKDYLCSDVNQQLKGILNKTALSAKQFPLPPFELQQQFASFVAQIDKSRFVVLNEKISRIQHISRRIAHGYSR